MLRGTGDDVLSCGHLESLTGSLQVPPHPRYSRSAAPGIGISSQSPSFRFLCLAEMSMLFCSWANKDEEEPDDDQDVDDEDQEGESKEEEKEEVKENTETVSEKGEKSEDSKDDGASVSEKPAPAFFCKWATEEEEYKSESDQEEEEEEEAANEEEVGEHHAIWIVFSLQNFLIPSVSFNFSTSSINFCICVLFSATFATPFLSLESNSLQVLRFSSYPILNFKTIFLQLQI